MMKNLIALIALSFALLSCEGEAESESSNPHDNLSANSGLVAQLRRVAQCPTSVDDIADGSSCFALDLPVTVVANGQEVVIGSVADYQLVRDIFAQDPGDVDTVALVFPVGVTYADYTAETFTSQAAFNAALGSCVPSVELACIGLQYPVTVKTFDANSQLADTFTIGSNQALYGFLSGLAQYDAVALDYPVTVIAPDGNPVTVADNGALAAAITSFAPACGTTGEVPDDLEEVIVQGTWQVAYFFEDGDHTSDYDQYEFTFFADGTATADDGNVINGNWDSYIDSGDLTLEFGFSGSALGSLEEDWTVTSFTATTIVMAHLSGGGGDPEYLTLQRNP